MNKRETGMLVAYVAGACPQQKMNELTPDAWHDILGHLEYGECREAARAVASRQPFVAPSEIIREIADKRSASQPHSNACRGGDCPDCRVSWCSCTCHPRAVEALTSSPRPTAAAVERRQGDRPRQLGPADLAAVRRSP
jgi:hypothetical protein